MMTLLEWRIAPLILQKKKIRRLLLVYANNPSIMIFDPVHIGPEQRFQQEFTATNSDGVSKTFTVILSEID